MTQEENLLRKIQELQAELDERNVQLDSLLDKIDDHEVEIMKYEEMFDEKAPKSKTKKAREEKLNLELSGKDHEIRELKDRMGFLRKEKIELQKKYELEVRKNSDSSVISVEKIREKEKAPLNVLLQELQDKINKQESIIRKLKSKDLGSDEYNETLKEKDNKIEHLTDQIADLTENLGKTTSDIEIIEPEKLEKHDKPLGNSISKSLLEELQNNLNKAKRHNDELKKKVEKFEKKGTNKTGSEENGQVLELQKKISQLTNELEHKNKTVEEKTTSNIYRESKANVNSLKAVVEELKISLSKAKSQITALQQKLAENQVQKPITESLTPAQPEEGKLKIQREMAGFLQQQLAEANTALKTKEEENITIKTEAIRIKKEYAKLENIIKLKDQKTNELSAQLQTQNTTSTSVPPDVKLRFNELQSLVDDLRKQNIQQRLEISQLRKNKQ
ncbi:MAG: hypothetical protein ACTSQA_09300 [Candidatus Heimdallarchaeaceae archaeon]